MNEVFGFFPHHWAVKAFLCPLTDGKLEAQRSAVTCSQPHSYYGGGGGDCHLSLPDAKTKTMDKALSLTPPGAPTLCPGLCQVQNLQQRAKSARPCVQRAPVHVGTRAEPHNGSGLYFLIQQILILVPDLPLIATRLGVCI